MIPDFNKQFLEENDSFHMIDLFGINSDTLNRLGAEISTIVSENKLEEVKDLIMVVHDLVDAQTEFSEAQKVLALYILIEQGLHQ